MPSDKEKIRENLLHLRKNMSSKLMLDKSRVINQELQKFLQLNLFNTLQFYYPIDHEVDIIPTIKYCLEQNKVVLLPKTDPHLRKMVPGVITDLNKDLTLRAGKIFEPNEKCKIIPRESLDLVLVPGIAFDKKGNRVGYGKGCFDNFLNGITALKIGLAYSFQIVNEIVPTNKDIPMDFIITEKELIKCNESPPTRSYPWTKVRGFTPG